MNVSRRRKWAAGAVLAVIAVACLYRPGAERLKSRIVRSLSLGIGRPVDVKEVHIQFVPPGFELSDLRVFDDPAYSSEPMLRAGEVTALIRLRSLVRGRLDLARLEITDPSLNLVRSANGGWNVQALLERSTHTPFGPTANIAHSNSPAFPYIEATGARINLKLGVEKMPYALTNTDLSLWQDSDNSMSIRLKGVPLRTDMGMSDTGTLQADATWQRATQLRDMPIKLNAEWAGGQLGQLTRLFTGVDRGWRGNAAVLLAVQGTPRDLAVTTDAALSGIRRYDIVTVAPVPLSAHCVAHYDITTRTLSDGECRSPLGKGLIRITGNTAPDGAAVNGKVEAVPAAELLALARGAKKNLAGDMSVAGVINGEFTYSRTGAIRKLNGAGKVQGARLSSVSSDMDLSLGDIGLTLSSGDEKHMHASPVAFAPLAPGAARLEFGPISVAIGGSKPMALQGRISEQDFVLALKGEASLAKSLRLARMLGLPAPQYEMQGVADGDIAIAGSWSATGAAPGFGLPRLSGVAHLHQVKITSGGRPVELSAADVRFQEAGTHISAIDALVAGTRWTGTIDRPLDCSTAQCMTSFDLTANEIDPGRIRAWIAPATAKLPWYSFLQANPHANAQMLNFRASGKVLAKKVTWRQWSATDASALVELGGGKITLTQLKGNIFGGMHQGSWTADYSAKPAKVDGRGRFTSVHFTQFKNLLHDEKLSAASGNADYEITAEGKGPAGTDYAITGSATVGKQKYVLGGTFADPTGEIAKDADRTQTAVSQNTHANHDMP